MMDIKMVFQLPHMDTSNTIPKVEIAESVRDDKLLPVCNNNFPHFP